MLFTSLFSHRVQGSFCRQFEEEFWSNIRPIFVIRCEREHQITKLGILLIPAQPILIKDNFNYHIQCCANFTWCLENCKANEFTPFLDRPSIFCNYFKKYFCQASIRRRYISYDCVRWRVVWDYHCQSRSHVQLNSNNLWFLHSRARWYNIHSHTLHQRSFSYFSVNYQER